MDLDEAVDLLAGTTVIQDGTRLGLAREMVLGVVRRARAVTTTGPAYDADVARYILGEDDQ